MKKFLIWIAVVIVLISAGAVVYFLILREDIGVSGGDQEGIEGIRPRSMKVVDVGSDYFEVEWRTNTDVVGYVKYGDTSTSISLIAQGEDGAKTTTRHKVKVRNLSSGKKYYYWVVSDDVAFGQNGRALEILTLSE